MNTRRNNDQLLIDGLRLKTLINAQVLVLGQRVVGSLLDEMNRNGFVFESGRTYSIEHLRLFLDATIGKDAAVIMIDRIKKSAAQDLMHVTASFALTKAQMEALVFEAREEKMTIEEMIGWLVRQNIPALLDVIETKDEARRQELLDALIDEDEKHTEY